jgi:hypothetical protein
MTPWTTLSSQSTWADVVSRMEKTLYLVVRYSVSSHEIWDNNNGRNYHVQIMREKVPKANKETMIEKPQESSLADLRHQLEEAFKASRASETVVFSPITRVADGDRRSDTKPS